MLLGHLQWIGKTPRMSMGFVLLQSNRLFGSPIGLLDAAELKWTLVLSVTVSPVVVPATTEPHVIPAERHHDDHIAFVVVRSRPEAPRVSDELHMALLSRPDVGHHARKPERHVDVGIMVILRCVSDALKRRTIRDLEQERVCRRVRHFLNCTHKSTFLSRGIPYVLR